MDTRARAANKRRLLKISHTHTYTHAGTKNIREPVLIQMLNQGKLNLTKLQLLTFKQKETDRITPKKRNQLFNKN